MRPWWAIAIGVVSGLLAGGVLLLVASQPRGQPIRLDPPPTALPCLVHVSGAVASPGVYAVSRQSRVQDAVLAAGGVLPEADLAGVNLAAFIEDGSRIWVPWKAQAASSPAGVSPAQELQPTSPRLPETSPVPSGLIDLNRASQSELESLPGIGPVLADRIIAYRQAHGPFIKVEDLAGVEGIGPSVLKKIEGLVTIGGNLGNDS